MVLKTVSEDCIVTNSSHFIKRTYFYIVLHCITAFAFSMPAKSQSVLTQHNNLQRTGWNSAETKLTQATVSIGNFGKIFSHSVDDQIYCQPLVVNNVNIVGAPHNVLIVATVNNTVYAFDADDPKVTAPYWITNITYDPVNYRPINNGDVGQSCGTYRDFSGNIGIVGTPVIDASAGIIYVVSRSVGKTTNDFVQYIHAIKIIDGSENIPPVFINPTTPGTGTGSDGVNIPFNQRTENQRPGLLLYNGTVYVSWASHCDTSPYHGWIVGYDAVTLAEKYVYSSSRNGEAAGIWMSGQAPAVDDIGNIYLTTGNGTTGVTGNPNDPGGRGESLLKLSADLKLQDFFTPADWDNLNSSDLDYGSDGVLLIPNTNLSLSGSKESYLYLINDNGMGHTTTDNSNVKQLLDINVSYSGDKHIHGSPAYYKDDKGQEYIYAWAEDGLLKQFPFSRSTMLFDINNLIVGNTALPFGMPGALISVSSNSTVAGTGIVWASHPINGDANQHIVPGILQAFDATDITHELWNSNMDGSRDAVGNFAKFVCPTIANGKVYLATFSNKIMVYGLNPLPATSCLNPPLPPKWRSADIGYVVVPGDACYNNGTYNLSATGDDIFSNTDAFHSVFQSISGNSVSITARVTNISNAGDISAKAGVMIRSNLDPGSPNVFMALSEGTNAIFQARLSQSAPTNTINADNVHATYWVQVTSNGNIYTGYVSPDGVIWNPVGSVTVSLGATVYAGLAYTSHNNSISGEGTAVFDNVTLSAGSETLPVTLINFKASNIDNTYSKLDWTTSQEINFHHFEIQHSTSNTNFETIGFLPGNGTSGSPSNYNFKDSKPAEGLNYYRLKMVDIDGLISYSSVLRVNFDLSIMQIYPNPASDHINLENNIHFTNGKPVKLDLINVLGQHFITVSIPTENKDILTVDLPAGIRAGSYYLSAINSEGRKQSWKIQIKN